MKRGQQPPDIRLARAFDFTVEDLAANRAGYMTWQQRGLFGAKVLRWWSWLTRWLFDGRKNKKRKGHVASVCGRAKLEHYIADRPGPRDTIFYEYYILKFHNSDAHFPLTRQQYRVLSEGVPYCVYYDPGYASEILSIERV